jgi:thioredoxin 2
MSNATPDVSFVACRNCGATNRVRAKNLGERSRPVCGRCKQPLSADGAATPLIVTDATFAAEVERSPLPVLVDAWAPWCAPCRTIAPAIEQLAAELAGRVRVAKLNVDENPATASRFDVRSIPTMLVMVGGREVDRIVGAQPKAAIRQRLESAVSRANER